MIQRMKANEGIQYEKLTPEEMKARGILGRLVGPCADFNNATRNGRKYSEQLWENVFNNPIMQEKIKNGVCFGELGHPADRTEIDPEKIAVCLRQQPVKDNKGQLIACFDILDTPNGRILKTLCDYGSTVGVSSRGQGDLITDSNGAEAVDPDTYECECWDVVLVPAVKTARMQYVRESLSLNELKMRTALNESLKSATEEERKVMESTLKDLHIQINEEAEEEIVAEPELIEPEEIAVEVESGEEIVEVESGEPIVAEEPVIEEKSEKDKFIDYLSANFDAEKVAEVCKVLEIGCPVEEPVVELESGEDIVPEIEEHEEECDSESCADIVDDSVAEEEVKVEEAIDDGDAALIKALQEALQGKATLESDIKSLQEKLAVSDAKVGELTEECNKCKTSMARLATISKMSKDEVSTLKESLAEKDAAIEDQKVRIARLVESKKKSVTESLTLNESVSSKDGEIKRLNESLSKATEEIDALKSQLESKLGDSNNEITKLTESVTKATTLKESYRKLANKAVNKYIDVKAGMLGLTSTDIKRKLGESYTLDDVDKVCDDLKAYNLNVSKLPFSIGHRVGVKVNESASTSAISKANRAYEDDDVDDDLIRIAKLK